MDVSTTLISATVAAAVTLLVYYTYARATEQRQIVRSRLTGELTNELPPPPSSSILKQSPTRQLLPVFPMPRWAADETNLRLARAGWRLSAGEFTGIRVVIAAVAFVASTAAVANMGDAPVLLRGGIPLIAAWLGWLVPHELLAQAHARRLRKIEEQLPEALTGMAKALRSGAGVMHALGFAAKETPAPLGLELTAALRDLELGADAEDVFTGLSKRVGSADLDIVVTAILIQRSVGGNLSDILANTTATIRSRANLYREVRVITTRQRTTARMVAIAPVVISVLIVLVNPKMGSLLFETTSGRIALAVGAGFELVGFLLIQRFSKIEV